MSELNEGPLSPSDAAKILAGQRWSGRSEESESPPAQADGAPFGKEGVERSQGFEPMRPAFPVKQPDDAEIPRQLLTENLQQDAATTEPIPVEYLEQKGEKAGQPMPDKQTVSAEQAASDLNRFREQIGESVKTAQDQELARIIDQLRAGDQQQEAQQAQEVPQPQQAEVAQPEAQPQQQQVATGDAKVTKLLQDNPELLAALQAEVGRHEQAAQQVIAANATAALASLVSAFPELSNVRADQIGTAIQVVSQQNPERAKAMLNHIEQVSRLVNQHQQVQAQQQQAWMTDHVRELDRKAKVADAEFDAHTRNMSNQERSELQQETMAMLHDYGLTDERIAQLWRFDETFRSFPAQRMMLDAVRYRRAEAGARAKVSRPVPRVQRPGNPIERGSGVDFGLQQLNARLNETGSAKDAAALLVAQRAARR